ncbi:hypothetical protein ABZZ20_33605 [Streptomyces sp. NPDC006430]|uniref:hypothetical protein n=1 Tax=Streptomyces sp. NPDC006430 TaxID=3154299 RepID=UPI0033A161A0
MLGRRWIYDGTHDPVLVAQLFALVLGEAQPQDQNESDVVDRAVTVGWYGGAAPAAPIELVRVSAGLHTTDLLVQGPAGRPTIRVQRVLRPGQGREDGAGEALGLVCADWTLPDGARVRGRYAVVTA